MKHVMTSLPMTTYPDVGMVDIVLVLCDLCMASLFLRHEVLVVGGASGDVRVHEPHPNTLQYVTLYIIHVQD
jgi:hypothetical protein